MGEKSEKEFEIVEFHLPAHLVEQLKKLSKMKGRSIDDEFTDALKDHLAKRNSFSKNH